MENQYLNRDLSWLSFNARVLHEATRDTVPLMERFKFLSIFSSNLDEFYRVRMPSLLLQHEVANTEKSKATDTLLLARQMIAQQLNDLGRTLRDILIPALQTHNIDLLYDKPIPDTLHPLVKEYFQAEVMAFLEIINCSGIDASFFAKNNRLYLFVFCLNQYGKEEIFAISTPSHKIPRFFSTLSEQKQQILFLDDIIKQFLPTLFPTYQIQGAWNIKITRNAELELADEYEGDLAQKIEQQLTVRDDGNATRFLYEDGIPEQQLRSLSELLHLTAENTVKGGSYHNLKDLIALPVTSSVLQYPKLTPIQIPFGNSDSIFNEIAEKDQIIHAPYQSYNTILKFFNEAATNENVKEIYTTLYRVAGDSRIVNALITAAMNGKRVVVFIELKARFDEENNINWSKKMKAAGVQIINSIPNLKVHAKVALVKRRSADRILYSGLIATGNLNEVTARFYTDHMLFTAHTGIVRELELLFIFLMKRRKPRSFEEIRFEHLLIAQFNLQQRFLELIDNEIANAKAGKAAGIIIKMNNLEEKVLINKLYEASRAGVRIQLIVRSICCLAAGIPGQSENISVTRIVDRYLEHARVFIFNNNGNERMFMGSSDWMNRNVYRRIEVCCPVYNESIRKEIGSIIALQLKDNVQAVKIDPLLSNEPISNSDAPLRSQIATYELLQKRIS